jgi:hypothetical protein
MHKGRLHRICRPRCEPCTACFAEVILNALSGWSLHPLCMCTLLVCIGPGSATHTHLLSDSACPASPAWSAGRSQGPGAARCARRRGRGSGRCDRRQWQPGGWQRPPLPSRAPPAVAHSQASGRPLQYLTAMWCSTLHPHQSQQRTGCGARAMELCWHFGRLRQLLERV